MSKVPLSTDGVTLLQSNLYALTDAELFAEADAVWQDFAGWVDNHIELTSAQLDWLQDLDDLFLAKLGVDTAIAFRNRLNLRLTLPSATSGGGKWFLDKNPITPKWEAAGIITASGELHFKLGYTS